MYEISYTLSGLKPEKGRHDLEPLRRVLEADLWRQRIDPKIALLRLGVVAIEAMIFEIDLHLRLQAVGVATGAA